MMLAYAFARWSFSKRAARRPSGAGVAQSGTVSGKRNGIADPLRLAVRGGAPRRSRSVKGCGLPRLRDTPLRARAEQTC